MVTESTQNTRLHYMDNLRALAMMLGIFFHAAVAYNPMMANLWITASNEQSIVLEIFAWFSHLFRMPLFFVIAGFFALFLIEKRGIKNFALNRSKRIVLPFFIFMPLIIFSVIAVISWGMKNVQNLTPMLQFFESAQSNSDAEKMPFSTMHLWFLFNLALFCIMAMLLVKFNIQERQIFKIFNRPLFLVVVFPLLLIPALINQPIPVPAPERIYPELWSFGYYGLFFFFGMALYKTDNLLNKLEAYVPWLLFTSLLGYSYFYQQLPKVITFEDVVEYIDGAPISLHHATTVIFEAYLSTYLTLLCLVGGRRFLNRKNTFFRYIADSSYWVYIIHLPVLFYLQLHLLDLELGAWTEFLLSSMGTLIIGMLTYSLIVRKTPIGTLLNGKKISKGKLNDKSKLAVMK